MRGDISDVLLAADAFVMSSRTEGLPMALLEAMSHSVPCIATAVGGIPRLLGEGAGILVPPGVPGEMAAAMTRVFESTDLRSGIIEGALARVLDRYSLDAVATRYLTLLGLPARWPETPG
jgi:glycosyltransferase involved in cell wall biosynthesis